MRTRSVESGRDRKAFARDAGMGQVSLISVLAGTLVAFASFAILLAIVAGILSAVGIDTAELTSNDYEELGIVGAIVAALVLFLSYFFGGYIAGRLARRAGALNGGLVLLLAVLIGAVIALVVGTQTDTEAVAADLRIVGVPTSGADYASIGTIAGIVSLVAMLAGAVLGGLAGERWHGKLAARALSPEVGPQAEARQEMVEAQQRLERQQAHPPVTGRVDQGDRDDTASGPTVVAVPQNELEARAWGARSSEATSTTSSVATTEPPRRRRQRPLRSNSPRQGDR